MHHRGAEATAIRLVVVNSFPNSMSSAFHGERSMFGYFMTSASFAAIAGSSLNRSPTMRSISLLATASITRFAFLALARIRPSHHTVQLELTELSKLMHLTLELAVHFLERAEIEYFCQRNFLLDSRPLFFQRHAILQTL